MENHKINKGLSTPDLPTEPIPALLHKRLDELILLLSESESDNELLEALQSKFNAALHSAADSRALESSKIRRCNIVHDEVDSDFGQLLLMNKLDKSAQKKLAVWQIITKVLRIIIALLLILLGFGMIIMPAPPYFEMFTLFYLNPNDGVTIMDVISLIIVFIGVYLLIRTLTKRNLRR